MKKKQKTRRQKKYKLLAVLFLCIGGGLILYPLVASQFNRLQQMQAVDGYISEAESVPEEEKREMLEAAAAYNMKLKNNGAVMTDPFDENAVKLTSDEYFSCLDMDGSGMMGYLDIPSIRVHLPVYHTTSEEVLKKAAGHLQGSSLPVGGDGTHCVLSAHTGLAGNRLFTDLEDVEVGDTFTVTVLGEELVYQVYDIEVVLPEDTQSLLIKEGEDLCTLVTCTPYGVNTHRLLVHGRRIPETEDREEPKEETGTENSVVMAMTAGIMLLAAAGTAWLWRRKRKKKRKRGQV